MHNILLDRLPTEYRGYLIRTDYRIGMQITSILENPDLEDEDRTIDSLYLLFGEGVPIDMTVALNGLKWFLSCGRKCHEGGDIEFLDADDVDDEVEEQTADNGNVAYDFEMDADYIEGCFRAQYGIELSSVKMHWFEFMALFKCLKDTQLNELMYYRTVDVSKLPKTQRPEMRRLQNKYKVRKVTASRKAELIACFGDEWRKHI